MSATVKGRSLLNRAIDALPFELHIPGSVLRSRNPFRKAIGQRLTRWTRRIGERVAAAAVWAAMKAKTKIGMGMKTKKKTAKKPILPTAKRGGILPILLMLGALGSLIDGVAKVAKAVSDSKATRRQLEELQRHNRAMENHGLYLALYKHGKGLYLGPYKRGQSVVTQKKKKTPKKH